MGRFRETLRQALPEIIGGWVIAVLGAWITSDDSQKVQNAAFVGVAGLAVIIILYFLVGGSERPPALPSVLPHTSGPEYPPTAPSTVSLGRLWAIPSGPVIMGSRLHVRESPPRRIYVAEFEIAENPVTVGQYTAFLAQNGYNEQQWWSEAGWSWRLGASNGWGRPDRSQPHDWVNQKNRLSDPVVGVTWYEAQAYCSWVGARKNRLVRLPSEEEWERAARGEDGRPWPWGNTFDRRLANTHERGLAGTVMAGALTGDRSPFGLADMGGNTQDWTSSKYQPLEGEQLPSSDLRVARGGSWNDTAFGSRTSFRHIYPPGYYFPFLSFRIVVERL